MTGAPNPDELGLWPTKAGGWRARVWAPEAQAVELLLPDRAGPPLALQREATSGCWRGDVDAGGEQLRYGYLVDGLGPLIDPFARAFVGDLRFADSQPGDRPALLRDRPWSVARRQPLPPHNWQRPKHRWQDSVIYECHLKGLTARDPLVPPEARGRLAAWADGRLARDLRSQGYTAVEFLPLMAFADERHLPPLGLRNYWGYNSYGFFAPDPRYGTAEDMQALVRACHAAGLEVILDVVYNHSAEGDHLGPTFAFKGLSDSRYYRHDPERPGQYLNPTGTGNSLNSAEPMVQRLVCDSLRYWHQQLGVDGFRFDLAPTLARDAAGRMGGCDLLDQIAADPGLSEAKLIAEPWDIGVDGYQQGGRIFAPRWHQWNDRYRDAARRLLAEPDGALRGFAGHLVGTASEVAFITAHDGFTLHDLLSYRDKQNQANGEQNRDGHGHNLSVNFGVEGPTANPVVQAARQRAARFLLALLAFSRPLPMFAMGDAQGRSQQGNNNAYCQDNPLSWLDPSIAPGWDLRPLLTRALALRRHWLGDFIAGPIDEATCRWYGEDGQPMTAARWEDPGLRAVTLCHADQLAWAISLDDRAMLLPGADWQVQFDSRSPDGQPKPNPATAAPSSGGAYLLLAIRSR